MKKEKKKKMSLHDRLMIKTISPIIDRLLHSSYDVYINEVFGVLESDRIISFESFSQLVFDKLKGGNN